MLSPRRSFVDVGSLKWPTRGLFELEGFDISRSLLVLALVQLLLESIL